MTWTVRPPFPHETDDLCALGRETFVETFGHLYSPRDLQDFLEQVYGPTGMPVELVDGDHLFRVAREADRLVGYCKLGPTYLPDPDDGRRRYELRQLYVRRSHRGTGLAHRFMEWALATARAGAYDEFQLSVWVENHRARAFYEKYGFVEVGKVAFMVGEQADDDRLYRLRLR